MKEKEEIELAIAGPFISLYNTEMNTAFEIVEHADAPDVRCRDSRGHTLNIEITLTEDQVGDIQALLGRSDHKSVEALRRQVAKVKAGKASPFEGVSCFQGNVSEMMVNRIRAKLTKQYGKEVLLVVYDSSPLGWNWERVVDQVRDAICREPNPFDRGIWVLSSSRDRITRVI